jgi:hypothetical protein
MNTVVFLLIRVVHVLLAAVWLGSTAFLSTQLMPAIEATGPAGGQVMIKLNRSGLVAFFASLGGVTVLTGIYLYWRFTGGFDPAVSSSHAGMAFGIGGVCGILAVILGGAVVGRSSKRIVDVMEQVMKLPDGPQKGALVQEANALKGKLKTFGAIVLLLQVLALSLMAVGHYI